MKKHKHLFNGFDPLASVRERLRAERERDEWWAEALRRMAANAAAHAEAAKAEALAKELFDREYDDSLRSVVTGEPLGALREELQGHGQCPWCRANSRTVYALLAHRGAHVGTRTYRYACRCETTTQIDEVETKIFYIDLVRACERDKAYWKAWSDGTHRGRR
jgi:hypothetical protein